MGFYFAGMSKYRRLFSDRARGFWLVNFGTLIAFTESIRLKCGRQEGLLSVLLSPFEWAARKVAPQYFPPKPDDPLQAVDSAEALATRLQAKYDASREAQIVQAKSGEMVDLSQTPLTPEEPFARS